MTYRIELAESAKTDNRNQARLSGFLLDGAVEENGTGSSEGRAVPVPFFRLDPNDTVKRKPL